jgi:hypothetical protein
MIWQVVLLIALAVYAHAAGAPVRIDDGDTLIDQTDTTVSTTAVLVKAANSNRASLNCTTTAQVRWGTSQISSTRGQIIPAGGSVEIKNTSSIYMIATGSNSSVSCTEETYSSSTGPVFSP